MTAADDENITLAPMSGIVGPEETDVTPPAPAGVDPMNRPRWNAIRAALANEAPDADKLKAILALLDPIQRTLAPANDAHVVSTEEIAREREPSPYVIQGLPMRPGPVTLVIAYAGSGKSVAYQSMLLSIATGRPVWGQFRATMGRTVYVDGEQGVEETVDRYQRLARGMGLRLNDRSEHPHLIEDAGDRLNIIRHPKKLDELGAREFYRRCAEGATIMVIDSLVALAPSFDENKPEIAAPVYMLGEISAETGCLIVLVHHAGKSAVNKTKGTPEIDPRAMGRGSSAIQGASGYAFTLDGKPFEPKLFSMTRGRSLGDPRLDDFYLSLEQVDVRESHDYHNPHNPSDPGGFRVVYKTKEQVENAQVEDDSRPRPLDPADRRLIHAVRTNRFPSCNAAHLVVRGNRGEFMRRWRRLLDVGVLVKDGGWFRVDVGSLAAIEGAQNDNGTEAGTAVPTGSTVPGTTPSIAGTTGTPLTGGVPGTGNQRPHEGDAGTGDGTRGVSMDPDLREVLRTVLENPGASTNLIVSLCHDNVRATRVKAALELLTKRGEIREATEKGKQRCYFVADKANDVSPTNGAKGG